MEAPKCKLCGFKHLLSEPHVFKDNQPKTKTMPTAAEINHTVETRKHCPTCTCKRVYKSAAERQKAYRDRHKPK